MQHSRAFGWTAGLDSLKSRNDEPFQHVYEHIDNVEVLESYCVGGYHPVTIGDIFNARYRVVHKLGHGTFSTIWLAQDQKMNRFVALKVCTADSDPREIGVLEKLSSNNRSQGANSQKAMTPLVHDKFYTEGPNGAHPCYVTEPARMSLSEAKHGSRSSLFQLDVARALAVQVALAVEYVHSQDYVHGDIHLGNVLLRMPADMNTVPHDKELSVRKLYEEYGEPQFEPIKRFDGKPVYNGIPSHAVKPIWLGKASDELKLSEANIVLCDFGEAFTPSKQRKLESHSPFVSRAPEARFDPHSISFPSDIWSLGCTIWGLFAQRPLFEHFLATEDFILREQVDALGLLPGEWWSRWEKRHDSFTEDGSIKNRESYRSWDDRFEGCIQEPRKAATMPALDPAEREALSSMLRWMLSFRPESRPTASQILQSEWMARWGFPTLKNHSNQR